MALDTYAQLWRSLLLRCPLASPFLAQDWVNHSWRELVERRNWSFLQKQGEFLINAAYGVGTASVAFNSNVVNGNGTTWTAAMIGRQFRIPSLTPIYTITSVPSATQLTLDAKYGGVTNATAPYSIYNAYVTVPSDFHSFISIWDAQFNWQLWKNVTQEEINIWDAQRANTSTAWVVSFRDYDPLASLASPPTVPLPRYEIWPHQQNQYVYPFLYESRPPDLQDAGATLPRYITGNVLLEGAMAKAARWPGPSRDQPNAMFDLRLAMQHEQRFLSMVMEAERQDDELNDDIVRYATYSGMSLAPLPWGDSTWLQRH